MASKKTNKNQKQNQAIVRIVLMVSILICANILASYFHTGIDLTKEKRFTLSEPTKKLLHNMKEVAVVDVYLKGKFPSGLQRLQEAVRERLSSFRDIAGNKIIFRFSDPFEGKTDEEKKQIGMDLRQKGIVPLELRTNDEEEFTAKLFFPYALIQYNGKEMSIKLTEQMAGRTSEENISYSETILEYKFASALNIMGKPDLAHLAYITGNGEPLGVNTYDMLSSLGHRYWLDTIDLRKGTQISLAYDAILIVQPTDTFTGPEKLKIDQYVMRGGHVLFSLNTLQASLDSLVRSPSFIAMEYPLELDDLIYRYGARVNKDMVVDIQNMQLGRTMNDGPPELHNWIYYPKLNPTSDHPIVRNMDFIRAGFTNSIDTILSPGIKKTVLLNTSKYSLKYQSPVRVSLSMMNYPLKEEMFNKSYLPVAVLLEGKFRSAFTNKLAPSYLKVLHDSLHQDFKAVCDSDNKIIITSIGDAFINNYNQRDGYQQMDYYFWTKEYFANRDFLLNCIEYLTDKTNILESRSKEMKLRLLDNGRVKDEKTTWQVVNVAIPVAIVLVFASAYFFFRKRRYEIKSNDIKPASGNV